MKISMHDMAVGSFVPMLESLAQLLAKGAAHGSAAKLDRVNAPRAPCRLRGSCTCDDDDRAPARVDSLMVRRFESLHLMATSRR